MYGKSDQKTTKNYEDFKRYSIVNRRKFLESLVILNILMILVI